MGLLIEGIGFGLVLAILLGPIFMVLTESSLVKGKLAGISVAAGVWISDILFIFTAYFFISQLNHFIQNDTFQTWSAIIGGLIICIFGIVSIFKKLNYSEEELHPKINFKTFSAFFAKGFLVNTVNPFTFIFWITTLTSNVVGRSLNGQESFIFLSAIFFTIVATDLLKVLLAAYFRRKLSNNFLSIFSKIAGIGLLCFGFYLLYTGFFKS